MISGNVNSRREAWITLELLAADSSVYLVQAMIDTGFDGWLTLPFDKISQLQLPWITQSRAQLADGSEISCDVHEGQVHWHGELRDIVVDAAETEPLVGMALMEGSELTVRIELGGKVKLETL